MSSEKVNSTRKRILDVSLRLLEDGTGQQVRMSDIAKAASISRQAVYLHFPSRAELLIATTRHLDELNDVEAMLAPSRNASSGRERLQLWVDVWGNYIPKIYGVARALFAMMETDEEAKAAWQDRMDAVRDGCRAAVQALAADDELTRELTETEATDLLWTLLSVRNWEHLRDDCGWSQESYLKHLYRTAELALLKRP